MGYGMEPAADCRSLAAGLAGDNSMRISHEAIYRALYVQGRGALKRELTACLRTGRALRMPRARARGHGKAFVTPELLISERPAEIEDRAVPGHWEGDLILGLNSSAIDTLVERTTRFTMLLHLPPMPDHGAGSREKNGPALAGHGAEAVRDAIAREITSLPEQLRRSMRWRARFGHIRQLWRASVVGGLNSGFARHSRLSSRMIRTTRLWLTHQPSSRSNADPAVAVVAVGQSQTLDGVAQRDLLAQRLVAGPSSVISCPADADQPAHPPTESPAPGVSPCERVTAWMWARTLSRQARRSAGVNPLCAARRP